VGIDLILDLVESDLLTRFAAAPRAAAKRQSLPDGVSALADQTLVGQVGQPVYKRWARQL